MNGIALTISDVPSVVIDQVPGHVSDRLGCPEVQFLTTHRPPVLPVHWQGSFQILRWGSQNRRWSLPYGYWVNLQWLESGALAWAKPQRVMVPANLGFDRGTWYLINEGVEGVVLPDVPGGPVAYLLTRPSTNYYRNMCQQTPVMPVLVNQTI